MACLKATKKLVPNSLTKDLIYQAHWDYRNQAATVAAIFELMVEATQQ